MPAFISLKQHTLDMGAGSNLIKAEDYLTYIGVQAIENSAKAMSKAVAERAARYYKQEKERGYSKGKALAKQENEEKVYQMVGQAIAYIASLESAITEVVNEALHRIIDSYDDNQLTLSIVRQGIQKMCNEQQFKIIVCPEQTTVLRKQIADFTASYPAIEFIEVVADSAMTRGGCRLETPVGVVNANASMQLKAIEKALKDVFSA